jgi:hypothetical protein
VVICGLDTLFLTLREEHGLKVFENRVLKKMFGPNREMAGGGKKLHNEELCNMYSPSIIRMIKSRRMTRA